MITKKFLSGACLAALSLICLDGEKLSAQTAPLPSAAPSGASATITFADGASIKLRSSQAKFRPVELLPGETVNIQLRLPRRFLDTPVAIQALDGGFVTQDALVAADGTAAIAFQAGVQPGLYRILLSARGRSALLQFWVLDSGNP